MNAAHVHLVFNHFPIIGALLGILLLLVARMRQSGDLELGALLLMVLAALTAIPTYFSGEGAEEVLEALPGFDESWVEPHESAGKITLVVVIVLGLLALYGIRHIRRHGRLSSGLWTGTLVLALAASAAAGYTAYIGGMIAHEELRTGFVAGEGESEGEGSETEAEPQADPEAGEEDG